MSSVTTSRRTAWFAALAIAGVAAVAVPAGAQACEPDPLPTVVSLTVDRGMIAGSTTSTAGSARISLSVPPDPYRITRISLSIPPDPYRLTRTLT
jgi:hypothetical protein